jgi:hypothetical protein
MHEICLDLDLTQRTIKGVTLLPYAFILAFFTLAFLI